MAAPKESVVHGSTARPQDLPSVDQLLRLADGRLRCWPNMAIRWW
jgi:hypothetical protein